MNVEVISKDLILDYANRIRNFECSAGECFLDYYFSTKVKSVSWAFWLLGKGYLERANMIINEVTKFGDKYNACEVLYFVNYAPIKVDVDGNKHVVEMHWDEGYKEYFLDCQLWSEFLISSDRYKGDFDKWLNNVESGGEY